MSKIHKKLFRAYIEATDNEISFDKFILKDKNFPPLPRASKWLEKNINTPLLLLLYVILMFAFIFGGFFIYSLFIVLKDYKSYRGKFQCISLEKKDIKNKYYFALSNSGYKDFLKIKANELNDFTVLSVPWVELNDNVKVDEVSIFKLLTIKDYTLFFWLIFKTFCFYMSTPSYCKWLLQIYSAPRWYLSGLAISKLTGLIVTSEHYDRWAILVDRICQDSKNKCQIIQHGSLKGLLTNSYLGFEVPNKLSHISEIFVYDDIELEIFKKYIIKQNVLNLQVHYINLDVKLEKISNNDFSILFIGHVLCENNQINLAELISSEIISCVIYYKEHPKARATKFAREGKWIFINKDDYFPDVDVVISYPSTLAYQYQNKKTRVLFHELNNIDSTTCINILNEIVKLAREYCEKQL